MRIADRNPLQNQLLPQAIGARQVHRSANGTASPPDMGPPSAVACRRAPPPPAPRSRRLRRGSYRHSRQCIKARSIGSKMTGVPAVQSRKRRLRDSRQHAGRCRLPSSNLQPTRRLTPRVLRQAGGLLKTCRVSNSLASKTNLVRESQPALPIFPISALTQQRKDPMFAYSSRTPRMESPACLNSQEVAAGMEGWAQLPVGRPESCDSVLAARNRRMSGLSGPGKERARAWWAEAIAMVPLTRPFRVWAVGGIA